jgi:probable F420-dependent oxidoreductase
MELGVVALLTADSIAITELAPAVEQAGLESLFLFEHTHLPVSRRELLDDPFFRQVPDLLDMLTVLGAAAAVTSRLKLGTGVCVPVQHDPIRLAKQVTTLDHLSAGRFVFGVGAGWLTEEIRNHGVDPAARWDIMREQVLAMKTIWTEDEAEFHGKHVDFGPLWLRPKPVQRPFPPVLVGGEGPRSLAAAAEYGDGWFPMVEDLDRFEASLTQLRRLCEERDRPLPPVTALSFELDAAAMQRCAALGVTRYVTLAPTSDRAVLSRFLDQVAVTADRAAG